jgi:hypothetical protein
MINTVPALMGFADTHNPIKFTFIKARHPLRWNKGITGPDRKMHSLALEAFQLRPVCYFWEIIEYDERVFVGNITDGVGNIIRHQLAVYSSYRLICDVPHKMNFVPARSKPEQKTTSRHRARSTLTTVIQPLEIYDSMRLCVYKDKSH